MERRHIQIKTLSDCCGCSACGAVCPKSCISFRENEHGFKIPVVDERLCINCGKCVNTCPVVNPMGEHFPIRVAGAVKPKDADLDKSSSAGIMYLLGKKIIQSGGIVFGARYRNDYSVCHDFTMSVEGLAAFQGSKYVQSDMGDSFRQCQQFLKEGRRVMFTGTPCEIAGLKKFLAKDYGAQLLTVDLICHGVPSPKVWKEYLAYFVMPKIRALEKNKNLAENSLILTHINFRDNRMGWMDCGLSYIIRRTSQSDGKGTTTISLFEHHKKDLFFKSFNYNLFLRETCYKCPAKLGRSNSDITLGDFWGVRWLRKDIDSTNSTAIVLLNSENGIEAIDNIGLTSFDSSFEEALYSNPNLFQSTKEYPENRLFWENYAEKGIKCLPEIVKKIERTKLHKVLSHLKQIGAIILKR